MEAEHDNRKQINQRNNNLAAAAANNWIQTHDTERMNALVGGYMDHLQRWLKKEYFAKACAGFISGSFEPGKGYVLHHVPPLSVPQWQLDAWVEREAERRECRKAVASGKGFKRMPAIGGES